jgi:hypothetical protein
MRKARQLPADQNGREPQRNDDAISLHAHPVLTAATGSGAPRSTARRNACSRSSRA